MAARKSREVQEAVALVVSGECDVYAAAARCSVSPSSIYRDPEYRAWVKQQKAHKA
jgi:hypothetical protein